MMPRIKVGRGVTGAVRYVLGEGRDPATGRPRTEPKGEQTRVAWIGGIGFGFEIATREDADLARRIMEFDALNQASKTKPCEKDCVHLSIGWRPGEEPTRLQMEEAALAALAALGMGNARALFVAHNDEPYAHLHIVASKINPESGKAYDLKGDQIKLSRWAEKYERQFSGGIVCLRREENNQIREAVERRDAGAVLDLMTQQRSTFKARDLERTLSKQIAGEFERAQFAEKVLGHPDIVRLSDEANGRTTRYTTQTVLAAEEQVLAAADRLARADRYGLDATARGAAFGQARPDGRLGGEPGGLSAQQSAAVLSATGSSGLALIDGQAGTGKSVVLNAVRQAYETSGYHVIGLGPTNVIAEDMRATGFEHARTLHSELFRLNSGRTGWNDRTIVILDEAAMIDTKLMAQLAGHADRAGAKLIMAGDDRQLSSIDRGGMFGVLKDRYGAAELSQVRRQSKNDDKRTAELMAEGNFHTALGMYEAKGAIHWTQQQDDARAALVSQWARDSAASPDKSRFVFAYTNAEVDRLNADLRAVRKERGEIGEDHAFQTKHGAGMFAERDRIQITGTDKARGLVNGATGTIEAIQDGRITLRLDGRGDRKVELDTQAFQDFRHGYAGTIHKGQGRTLDQTYLLHSEHWRSAASYVALTRHRDSTALFVARNTAEDVNALARQMARVDERRAASHFFRSDALAPVRPVAANESPAMEQPGLEYGPRKIRTVRGATSGGMVPQQHEANKALARAKRGQPRHANANQPLTPDQKLSRHGDAALQAQYAREDQQRQQQDKTATPSPADPAPRGNVPAEKQAEHKAAQEKTAKSFVATREIGEGGRPHDRDQGRGSGGGGGRGRSR